jgi:hypothetical protein
MKYRRKLNIQMYSDKNIYSKTLNIISSIRKKLSVKCHYNVQAAAESSSTMDTDECSS